MPVGTAATVKGLTPRDLRETGAQIVLANTYHLWLRPGRETLVAAGGLHRFMAWERPILTDSGGFQVFSLESRRKLDDDGVTFRSHLDGSTHRFTPENVVAFQEELGVDVAMMLDVCVKLPASAAAVEESVRRTSAWARARGRSLAARADRAVRDRAGRPRRAAREHAARANSSRSTFSGYAIGGLSVGETREEMVRFARFTAALLPAEKPRYLMGVGTVRDLIAGIDCGIDMFDCVYPTRSGRHGRAMTRSGEFNLLNAGFRARLHADRSALRLRGLRDLHARLSRASSSEPRKCWDCGCFHITMFTCSQALMAEARAAIEAGTWVALRDSFAATGDP